MSSRRWSPPPCSTPSSATGSPRRRSRTRSPGSRNHRAFHERLTGEVARARRHERDLSLVLIDVDTFKAVNDSAGHEAGDRVLAEVAGRLRALSRGGDLLARIGGDEFAWLLPETSAADALSRRASAPAPRSPGRRCSTATRSRSPPASATSRRPPTPTSSSAWPTARSTGPRPTAATPPTSTTPRPCASCPPTERADQLARHQALLGLRALARAIDAKDPSTHEHSGRVAALATALARARGWSEERVRLMEEAALVHDVGKIGIADAILLKPGRLTDEEYTEVKRHAALGAQIVEDVLTPEQVEWIRHHHERPDGRGYPDALRAERAVGRAPRSWRSPTRSTS